MKSFMIRIELFQKDGSESIVKVVRLFIAKFNDFKLFKCLNVPNTVCKLLLFKWSSFSLFVPRNSSSERCSRDIELNEWYELSLESN